MHFWEGRVRQAVQSHRPASKARNKPLIDKILMPVLPQQDNCNLNILSVDTAE